MLHIIYYIKYIAHLNSSYNWTMVTQFPPKICRFIAQYSKTRTDCQLYILGSRTASGPRLSI